MTMRSHAANKVVFGGMVCADIKIAC